jgi:hypothetical protein
MHLNYNLKIILSYNNNNKFSNINVCKIKIELYILNNYL